MNFVLPHDLGGTLGVPLDEPGYSHLKTFNLDGDEIPVLCNKHDGHFINGLPNS